jgi:hypothetical protein
MQDASGQLHAPGFSRLETNPLPIEQEDECTAQLLWTFRKTEKFHALFGIQTPDRPARSVVTTLTALLRSLILNISKD